MEARGAVLGAPRRNPGWSVKTGQSPAGTIESLPFPFGPCPAVSIRPLVGSPTRLFHSLTRLSTVAGFQSSLRDCVLISYPTRDSGGRRQPQAPAPPSRASFGSCLRHLHLREHCNKPIPCHVGPTNVFQTSRCTGSGEWV